MTLVDSGYVGEIIGALRADGLTVHHFAPIAEPGTVLARISKRGLGRGLWHEQWAVDWVGPVLDRLRQPEFATHVHTDHRSVAEVADAIAASAGLTIEPSCDGPLRAWLRRQSASVRHIRSD